MKLTELFTWHNQLISDGWECAQDSIYFEYVSIVTYMQHDINIRINLEHNLFMVAIVDCGWVIFKPANYEQIKYVVTFVKTLQLKPELQSNCEIQQHAANLLHNQLIQQNWQCAAGNDTHVEGRILVYNKDKIEIVVHLCDDAVTTINCASFDVSILLNGIEYAQIEKAIAFIKSL